MKVYRIQILNLDQEFPLYAFFSEQPCIMKEEEE